MDLKERFRGAMLGLAVGDAVGATLEFKLPGTFEPIDDIVGGGPFNLEQGQWTDDTSMALCLAQSLVEREGFDPHDQMQRYLRWWHDGYMSSAGKVFDIGNTVLGALRQFEESSKPYSGSTEYHAAGNGSLMRLAPIPLFFWRNPRLAIDRAKDSSRTTHGAQEAVDACRYFAALIVGALQARTKAELLLPRFEPVGGVWKEAPLAPKIDEIAAGSFTKREPPKIKGSGYVVDCLEAALWAFHRSEDFRTGALMAVNLGDDADTTGAVFGQLAGAYYGEKEIPEAWKGKLAKKELISELADRLFDAAPIERSNAGRD